MKKALFLCAIISVFAGGIQAQVSQEGLPISMREDLNKEVPVMLLEAPLIADEHTDEKNGNIYEYARSIYCDISPENAGVWETLADGSKVWRLSIASEGALALGLYYDAFWIPSNGELFVYNEDKTQIIGKFTSQNNHESGLFANELIQGNFLTLEYHQKGEGMPILHINEVAYAFRGVKQLFEARGFGDSDDCQVNINCSEGDEWQDVKRAACRISVKTGNMYGWCSGSLINNTAEDCTPYVLTADHCAFDDAGNQSSNADHNQWIFYFNFEAEECENPNSSPGSNTITGCSVKAYSSAIGGINGNIGSTSDFYLVELNEIIPHSYGAYMAGWNRSTTASSSGVSIHHPSGDIKKISTYTSTLGSAAWQGWGNSHWRVSWVSTENGHGVTEGGSSGSPIFNANKQIIGDLSGGSSYCNFTSGQDLYGKFSHSWDQTGASSTARLKPWLDPENTGVMYMEGKTCGTSFFADFEANITHVITGGTTTFSYTGTDNPTAYNWVFYGGDPITSDAVSPTVTYANDGNFTAKLVAELDDEESTILKAAYIEVSPNGEVESNVEELELEHHLFPNPTTGLVYIALNKQSPTLVNIYDIVGNKIYETTITNETASIDLSKYADGVYLVELISEHQKSTEQVILNR